MTKALIRLLRPQQWVKNLFIFLPLFFSGHINDSAKLLNCFWTAVGFSLLTSGVYCFNDILDASADKLHPKKKYRPIAMGVVSKQKAAMLMLLLWMVGFMVLYAATASWLLVGVAGIYMLLNIAYSTRLKNIAILDVFIISLGFVIRLLLGGLSGSVSLSHWIVIMTFLLSLFLAFAKRRDEVLIHDRDGIMARSNIDRYNIVFLDAVLPITASVVIVSYILYTVSEEVMQRFQNQHVYITAIFVIGGIFRYLQLTLIDSKSDNPTAVLLRDRFIQACLLGWIATFTVIIYWKDVMMFQ